MGNCFSLTFGINYDLSNLGGVIGYILYPRRHAEILRSEMNAAKAVKVDVEEKIKHLIEGNPCLEMTAVVKNWIAAVDQRDTKVEEILSNNNGLSSSLLLGYNIETELEIVRRLKSEGEKLGDDNNLVRKTSSTLSTHNDVLPERLQCSKIIVGIEETMSKVLKCLKDDEVGVIGIHGMGGVGKTTLINEVINRLRSSSSSEEPIVKFKKIIQVVVSQKLDVRKIQQDMAKQLGLSENEFKNETDTNLANLLFERLSKQRFLLVMDDMWADVDLCSIGIPSPQERLRNRCKVILTTRDAKVCATMGANKKSTVRVGCLRDEDSWELFQKTVGWDNREFGLIGVHEIAKEMVSKCGGLPLVLTTIARAMSSKETFGEWRNARETLKNFPHEIHGMDHVFGLLKFSYDNLKEDKHRYCLLYSALFPEDAEISIREMVDYCIGGGGVVDNSSSTTSDINSLRTKGANIVSELIHACLLQRGKDEDQVIVHDTIREMILKHNNREHRILSDAGKGLWGVVKIDRILCQDVPMMVSLRNNHIRKVVVDHENLIKGCNNNMQVLLLSWNFALKNLPGTLFKYFPHLRVLDLSSTSLKEIPASLCMLKSLQYLNLSGTGIKALPKEMGNLSNLMQLNLSLTFSLCEIPNGVFSSLSKLQSLNLHACKLVTGGSKEMAQKVFKELDDLPQLNELNGMYLDEDLEGVKFLVEESNNLYKSITMLCISGVDLISHGLFQRIGSRSKKLERLNISNFLEEDKEEDLLIEEGHFTQLKLLSIQSANSLQRIIILKGRVLEQLTALWISDCHGLRDLACLWQLPSLKSLIIQSCDRIMEVLPPQPAGDGDQSHGINYHREPLLKVQHINLSKMKSLGRISSGPLVLSSLVQLLIEDCPSLKELSIVPSNSQDVQIRCQQDWWEGLRWENGAPPPNFIPQCQPWESGYVPPNCSFM